MSDRTLTISYGEFSRSFSDGDDPFPLLDRIFGKMERREDWRSRIPEAMRASADDSDAETAPAKTAPSRKPQVRIIRGARPASDAAERGKVLPFRPGGKQRPDSGTGLPLSRFVPRATDNALTDMLEFAIIWLSASVGREEFTTVEAMDALTSLEQESGRDQSPRFARLMAFQLLVETGRVRPRPEGLFAVTRDALCRYEQRLRA